MEISSKPQDMEIITQEQQPQPQQQLTSTTNFVKISGTVTSTTDQTIYNINGSSSSSSRIPTPPHTPKIISRSESAFQPSTFVQADTTTFKQVVQMLTGSSDTAKKAASDPPAPQVHATTTRNNIPPIKTGQKKQGFKLYERRNSIKNNLMISPLNPDGFNHQNFTFSPRTRGGGGQEILSPSILDFPSLVLSPKTPLNADDKSPPSSAGSLSEEEKAIAEKKFYLHPSPRTTTPRGDHPPPLLSLFPVTSPRLSGSSS